ncbi:uncharacterized protein LOC128222967 [Mya arenaria]|uniref:uncharacterized protein LOC128222967 n=1 Tax=Mya arenaria TaxID=6604 RepID=UPI0022E52125|nr:uncharacterized protein LOC128222967 [Mya arenaria]
MSTAHVQEAARAVDGLPKQFVTSLRILFDILDEEQTGYVRLRDIETRWHEEGVKGLPCGVIDALRKVAPKNGKLTFENFVVGLKQSLLRNNGAVLSSASLAAKQRDSRDSQQNSSSVKNKHVNAPSSTSKQPQYRKVEKEDYASKNYANMANYMNIERPAATSAPVTLKSNAHVVQRSQPKMGTNSQITAANTATVRPNNVLQSQNIELRNKIYNREQMQHASVVNMRNRNDYAYPHDLDMHHSNKRHSDDMSSYHKREVSKISQRPHSAHPENQRPREVHFQRSPTDFPAGRPDRPPPYRWAKESENNSPPALPPKTMKGKTMRELQNWHQDNKVVPNVLTNGHMHTAQSDSNLMQKSRTVGNDIYVNIEEIRRQAASQKQPVVARETGGGKKPRRKNSRRHTLSSGIDYNVIRRMKQLEQERDVLIQGLDVVERARDWYLSQISTVAERQAFAEKTSCSDGSLQSHQERMDFVRSRINDVNLNLKSLMETTESGFPAHMNLAISSPGFYDDNSLRWLKDQNKQLTHEVGHKSEKITQLEQEKASLIRDLFEARVKHKTNYDDTTFM